MTSYLVKHGNFTFVKEEMQILYNHTCFGTQVSDPDCMCYFHKQLFLYIIIQFLIHFPSLCELSTSSCTAMSIRNNKTSC